MNSFYNNLLVTIFTKNVFPREEKAGETENSSLSLCAALQQKF